MIHWETPVWLWALAFWLPLSWLYIRHRRQQQKAWMALGDPVLLGRLGLLMDHRRQTRRFLMLGFAATALVVALANPQIGRRYERVKQRGVDLIVALDISQSMLAEDEQPNRLARAKLLVSRLLEGLEGDRFGLVLFAGNAFVQIPLTTDYGAANSILQPIGPEAIPKQGTAIGEAIRVATEAFKSQDGAFRALVIISDGEDHEGQALELAEAARKQGLRIHCVGVGGQEGAMVPEVVRGQVVGEKRDASGQVVLSRMNPAMLASLAEAGGGSFWPLEEVTTTQEAIEASLGSLTEQEFDERYITDYEDQFDWFLFLGFALLVLEAFLSTQRRQPT